MILDNYIKNNFSMPFEITIAIKVEVFINKYFKIILQRLQSF
jgi:hypothetical protein